MLKKVHAVMGPLSSASCKAFEFLPYVELLYIFRYYRNNKARGSTMIIAPQYKVKEILNSFYPSKYHLEEWIVSEPFRKNDRLLNSFCRLLDKGFLPIP